MSEKARRPSSSVQDITATPEYRKMREAYPDYPEDAVRELAEQAIKVRLQRDATEIISKSQGFEAEVNQKLTELLAQLAVKYNYDIYNKEICVQTPRVELPYQNIGELAQNFRVLIRQGSLSSTPARLEPAQVATPAETPRTKAGGGDPPSGAARGLFRILRTIIVFVGVFLIFFGIYSSINTEDILYLLIYAPIGILVLFLLRLIPRG